VQKKVSKVGFDPVYDCWCTASTRKQLPKSHPYIFSLF